MSGNTSDNEKNEGVAKDVVKVSDNNVDPNAPVESEQVYQFDDSRKLGVTSAVLLIINKMIGTGIFSTPSGIFVNTGSVGVSLMLWVLGGVITFCGLSVWLEFGLAIPRSGGEKNYLERVYRRPRLLASCMFAAQMVLLGFSSGNSLSFGRYVLFASGQQTADTWTARGIGVVCVTFCCLIHALLPKWGIRIFNFLGIFKVIILTFIVFSGFAALAGRRRVPDPGNFDNAFAIETTEDYGGGGAYAYATSLLRIIYSFKGWESANYVASEISNPRKTLRIAAPLAIGGVTILYILANVAYFSAIPKQQMATSEALVAGVFFRNVFGGVAGSRALPSFVAASNLGCVMAVSFAHSRVYQEFAKEGILPFSRFFASNKPFNAPAACLALHWAVSVTVLLAPPPGPAYNFLVDLYTYPGSWVNAAVCLGLLYLQYNKKKQWASPFHSYLPFTVFYFLVNAFLAFAPFIPPTSGPTASGYYFAIFSCVGVGVLLLGALWRYWFMEWFPKIRGHRIEAEHFVSEETGEERVRYRKVYAKDL
ncbi:hypothetical protein KVT40_006402 [Elsinoe batatas]|uniref:High-affinity methionine permease n=1 Tax=Elsinoe batatas TaxID=2601811 RepID=A0A8K0L1M3_9PEZI|nr:hypothetical protein KVT40_006402 [Elsinoe batatas]